MYMAETEDCEYVFNWKTPAACPVKDHPLSRKDCVVKDDTFGFYSDLSVLRKTFFRSELKEDVVYHFGLCGNVSGCGDKVHSCLLNSKSPF